MYFIYLCEFLLFHILEYICKSSGTLAMLALQSLWILISSSNFKSIRCWCYFIGERSFHLSSFSFLTYPTLLVILAPLSNASLLRLSQCHVMDEAENIHLQFLFSLQRKTKNIYWVLYARLHTEYMYFIDTS